MAPKVSVVMSVYNSERYLREAVESILNQTFTDFEFIIVDDGSTDQTREIVERFANKDNRIRVVRNERCLGLTRSLNRGLFLVRGEYIARQDADDISLSDRLSCQVSFLDEHPSVGVVGCRLLLIDNRGISTGVLEFPTQPEEISDMLPRKNVLCHGSVVMRRSCLERAGYYREFFRASQDRDLWLRLNEHCHLVNLPSPLYKSRLHPDCITAVKRHEQLAFRPVILEFAQRRREQGVDAFGLHFGGKWMEPSQLTSRIKVLSYTAYVLAMSSFYRGRQGITLGLLMCSILICPTNRVAWHTMIDLGKRLLRKCGKVFSISSNQLDGG